MIIIMDVVQVSTCGLEQKDLSHTTSFFAITTLCLLFAIHSAYIGTHSHTLCQ